MESIIIYNNFGKFYKITQFHDQKSTQKYVKCNAAYIVDIWIIILYTCTLFKIMLITNVEKVMTVHKSCSLLVHTHKSATELLHT